MLDPKQKHYVFKQLVETPNEFNSCKICDDRIMVRNYPKSAEARCTNQECSVKINVGFSNRESIRKIIKSYFSSEFSNPKFCENCGTPLTIVDNPGKFLIDCDGCRNTVLLVL